MKNLLIIAFVLLFFSSTGWCLYINDSQADTYDDNDVGALDTFLVSGPKLSGFSNETNWANNWLADNGYASVDWEETNKVENVDYWKTSQEVNGDIISNTYAFHMDEPPVSSYFILKNAQFVALYANNNLTEFGVFDTSYLPEDMKLPDSWVISHVSRSESAPVPEPATMLLFGVGLLGVAGVFRKKK